MPFLVIPGVIWLKGVGVAALAAGIAACGVAAGAAGMHCYNKGKAKT